MKTISIRIESAFECWDEFYDALKLGKTVRYQYYWPAAGEHLDTIVLLDKDGEKLYYMKHDWERGLYERRDIGSVYDKDRDLTEFTLVEER